MYPSYKLPHTVFHSTSKITRGGAARPVQAVHVNGGNDTIFRSLTLTLDTGNLGHGTTSTYGNITPVYVVVLAGGLLVLSGPELHTA